MRVPIWLLVAVAAVAVLPAILVRADGTEDVVRALRKDSSLKVRTQAALVLGERGGRDAVPALCAALESDHAAAVRIAAATALGKIGDDAARPSLEAAYRSDRDPAVRAAAARAIAALESERLSAVEVEEPNGSATAAEREVLREALSRHLAGHGFAVVRSPEDAAIRLKPALLALSIDDAEGKVSIAVKASVMAVDGNGRMEAMVEGGARLRASGGSPSVSTLQELAARALDAAAKSLSDDLAERLH